MPKLPMDYSKTIIYKIEHIENDNLVYVGHTTNWDKRKCQHKSNCYNDKKFNQRLYQMIRDNGGWSHFNMIEVAKYTCKDKREAERRENERIKELKANMNTVKSFRTEEEKQEYGKEYNVEHRQEKDIYNREYRQDNKEKIKEYEKQYREANKEKKKGYNKEYYENNKEKMKGYNKEYYENNKEKIKEYQKMYREAIRENIILETCMIEDD